MAKIRRVSEEETQVYMVGRSILDEEEIIQTAREILEARFKTKAESGAFTRPEMVKSYLQDMFQGADREEFWVIYLDSQHRVIKAEMLFIGTINASPVYPREVVKGALLNKAQAVMLAHNHPSGLPEPSNADQRVTRRIKEALETIDVSTLDHFVVGYKDTISFAERGLI